jgi:hypothetical protein
MGDKPTILVNPGSSIAYIVLRPDCSLSSILTLQNLVLVIPRCLVDDVCSIFCPLKMKLS